MSGKTFFEPKIPSKIAKVFERPSRYKCFYGGRGSGKSKSVALMALAFGALPENWYSPKEKLRILCTREYVNSIRESILAELKENVHEYPFLQESYEVGANFIRCRNGTEFIFVGMQKMDSIKSMGQIDICLIEEAETVSKESWEKLVPTIRNKGSEIWVIWNPEDPESPTNQKFLEKNEIHDKDCRVAHVNYYDNPWFPDVLDKERLNCKKNNPDDYEHVWLGSYREITDAQIFKGKYIIQEFDEPIDIYGNFIADGPYYGTDFGFSYDPTAAVRCFIHDSRLYISHEAGGVQIPNSQLPDKVYSKIPGHDKYTFYGDSARPETIHDMNERGIKMVPVKKWKGSVEDGVEFLRGFDMVIIHPRCQQMIKEAKYYSYKVDKKTGNILPVIVDAFNHYWDAVRYALQPVITSGRASNTFELI